MLYVLLALAVAVAPHSRKGTMLRMHKDPAQSAAVDATVKNSLTELNNIKKTVTDKFKFKQGPDSFDATAFDEIITKIRDNTAQAIYTEIDTVQNEMANKGAAITQCATTHGYLHNSDAYLSAKEGYEQATQAHGTAAQEHTGICQASLHDCSSRDQAGLALYHEVVGSPNCELPMQPSPTTVFDESFPLAQAAEWASTIGNKHEIWSVAKGMCSNGEVQCSNAEAHEADLLMHLVATCSNLAEAKQRGLSAYDECFDLAQGDLAGFHESIHFMFEGWGTAIEQLETLICYIKVGSAHLASDSIGALPETSLSCAHGPIGPMGPTEMTCDCSAVANQQQAFHQTWQFPVQEPVMPPRDIEWDHVDGCVVEQPAALGPANPLGPATTVAPGPPVFR